MFHSLELFLTQISAHVPLPLFLFFGSITEEIIAPIPSLLVPTTAGSIAAAQGFPWPMLLLFAVIGATGKVIGATVIYFIADVFEDIVIGKFGKFIGVTHEQIEAVGRKFTGGWRDYGIIFLLRALPALPSTPISFGCGVIKLRLRTYIIGSFLGSVVRDFLFLYFGYVGLGALEAIGSGVDTGEKVITIAIAVLLFGVIAWFYWKRKKG